MTGTNRVAACIAGVAFWAAVSTSGAHAASGRERAIAEIPELMGRILETQEEIREHEEVIVPEVARYDAELLDSKRGIDAAGSEEESAEALVRYVETYAARLDVQERGLEAIEGSVARMRADARELLRAARSAAREGETPAERKAFFADQFQ